MANDYPGTCLLAPAYIWVEIIKFDTHSTNLIWKIVNGGHLRYQHGFDYTFAYQWMALCH